MIPYYHTMTTERATGLRDARPYAERLVTRALHEGTIENVARALTFVPPAVIDALEKSGLRIVNYDQRRELNALSAAYPTLSESSRRLFKTAAALYVAPDQCIYLYGTAHEHHAMALVHEIGHAVDHLMLLRRHREDPERFPHGPLATDAPKRFTGPYYFTERAVFPYRDYARTELEERVFEALSSGEFVSAYAKESVQEAFAEAFRCACDTGSIPGSEAIFGFGLRDVLQKVAPTFDDVFERIFQELQRDFERSMNTPATEIEARGWPGVSKEAEARGDATREAAPAEKPAKRDFRAEITNRIVEELERGHIPWEKPWEISLPYNATRGNYYRGMNQLILMLVAQKRGFHDPRWMTFKQAIDKGWAVRKGEKGQTVEYWKPAETLTEEQKRARFEAARKKNPKLTFETFSEQLDAARAGRWQVFYATVFNAAQIDVPVRDPNGNVVMQVVRDERGRERERPVVQPLSEAVPWSTGRREVEPVERVEQLIAATGARVIHGGDRACYVPSLDTIYMPPRDAFKDSVSYYATLLHETGHWTGHVSRLDRSEFAGPFGSPEYAKEELRAELASVFMSAETGLPYDVTNHAAYVQSWIAALKNDKNEIFRAARDAEKISEFVFAYEKGREIEREGIEPDGEVAGRPLDLSALPAVDMEARGPLDYDFTARVVGRSADEERVFAKVGSQTVAIGRAAFSEVPANREQVIVEHGDGGRVYAMTERQMEVRVQVERALDRGLENGVEVA